MDVPLYVLHSVHANTERYLKIVQDFVLSVLRNPLAALDQNVLMANEFILSIMKNPLAVLDQNVLVIYNTLERILDSMFGFRKMWVFFKYVVYLQCGLLGWDIAANGFYSLFGYLTSNGRYLKKLRAGLDKAVTFREWYEYATEIDKVTGGIDWREVDYSRSYDQKAIRQRISNIDYMMKKKDIFSLIFRLRGGISRDKFGVQSSSLYTRALSGTKNIITHYTDTVCKALAEVAKSDTEEDKVR